jgi:nicotinate-nucleotide adenylyltransferase
MVRLGVFGGSFNPPHLGHLRVADAACKQFELDEIMWIPTHVSPFKTQDPTADAAHRIEMTRRTVASRPAYSVSRDEIDRGGVSFTVDTLRAVAARRPEAELFLLMGADAFADFESWKDPEAIRRMARLVVYPRGRLEHVRGDLRSEDGWLDGPTWDISSEDIRSRIERGESAAEWLPGPVWEYIVTNGLYGSTGTP